MESLKRIFSMVIYTFYMLVVTPTTLLLTSTKKSRKSKSPKNELDLVLQHGFYQRRFNGAACKLDMTRAAEIAVIAWRESSKFREVITNLQVALGQHRRDTRENNNIEAHICLREARYMFNLTYGGAWGFELDTKYGACNVCNTGIPAWRNCRDCADAYFLGNDNCIIKTCLDCSNPQHQYSLEETLCEKHGGSTVTYGDYEDQFEECPEYIPPTKWEDFIFELSWQWQRIHRLFDRLFLFRRDTPPPWVEFPPSPKIDNYWDQD